MPLDSTTAITVDGITVWDEGSGSTITNKAGTSTAWSKFRCAWGDQGTLIQFFLGGVTNVNGTYAYRLPKPFADWGGLICRKADVKGEGISSVNPANGAISYTWAVITFGFEPPQWKVGDPKAIGEDELETSTTGICLSSDNPSFKFADGTLIAAGTIPAIEFTTVTYNKTRHFVPTLPEALIASLIDSVNSTPIFGCAAEFVKFKGARSQRTLFSGNAAGEQTGWSITYTFEVASQRSAGHNSLPKPGSATWKKFTDLTGNPLFPLADLNQLFS